MERYLRVNLLGLGPRLVENEFTGSRLAAKFEKHCSTQEPPPTTATGQTCN